MPNPLEYEIKITRTGDGASAAAQDLKKIEDAGQRASDQVKRMGDSVRNLVATLGVGLLIRESVRAFTEQERAVERLNGTLRASGQFTEEYSQALQDAASVFQDLTGVQDDMVNSVQGTLIAFGAQRDQMARLTRAALDLARGLGQDAPAAALSLGKVLEGETGTLGRYGFQIDDTASNAEKLEQVLAQVERRFGGLANATGRTAELNRLKNAFGDLKEELGGLFLTSALPLIGDLTQITRAASELIKNNTLAREFLKQFIEIGASIAAAAAGLKLFNITWGLAGGAAIAQATSLTAALNAIPKQIQIAVIALATVQIVKAIKEGVLTLESFDKENESRSGLERRNDELRPVVEKQITEALASGKIGFKQADELRIEIAEAFKKDTKSFQVGATLGPVNNVIQERNPRREAETLSRIAQTFIERGPAQETQQVKQLTAEQIAALKQIHELRDAMHLDRISGIERERYALSIQYAQELQQIEQLAARAGFTAEEKSALITELDETHKQRLFSAEQAFTEKLRQEDEKRARAQMESLQRAADFQLQLQDQILSARRAESVARIPPGSRQERSLIAARADDQRAQAASAAREGQLAIGSLQDLEEERYIELLELNQQLLDANLSRIDAEAQAETQRLRGVVSMAQIARTVSESAQQSFAGGFANAFLDFATGIKSGEEAVRQFAATFLRSIAEIIIQLLILRAIKSLALGFAGGGVVSAAAQGGFFAPRKMAEGGLEGVQDVSQPTFFPRFNVLAGEAGREMMAVLAQPQVSDFGGMRAVIGRAQGARLALVNADELFQFKSGMPRMAASGGLFSSAPSSAAGETNARSTGAAPSGEIVIRIEHSEEARASMIKSAVQGAEVRVTQQMTRNSPLARATKALIQ